MIKGQAFLYSAALIFVSGCMTAPLMQESYFNQVASGVNISDVECIYGEPYEVRILSNGRQEYVYIQRIDLGRSAVEQLEFVFVVDQGTVVGKDCRRHSTSSIQFFN